jgi:exopolysaccharide biosynthesis polyprenyl glycosylphosphotransferase
VGMTRRYILLSLFKFFDLALLAGSFVVAALASLRSFGAVSFAEFLAIRISVRNFVLFAGLLLLWHSVFSFLGLYESKRLSHQHTEVFDVLKATSLATVALLLVGSLFSLSVIHPLFLIVFWLVSTSSSVLSRRMTRFLLEQIRLRGRNLRQIVIVGTNSRAIQFAQTLEAHPAQGCRILGFVDQDWPGMEEFHKTSYAYICDLNGFLSFLRESVVDEVVIALPIKSSYYQAARIAELCGEQGITTRFLSDLFERKLAYARPEYSDYDTLITIHAGAPQGRTMFVKRLLDILISLLCIICFTPLFLITAILIKLSSPGPVFFVQKRLGLNKRVLSVCKFRTMVEGAEEKQAALQHLNEITGPVFKITDDPRITAVGKFLRKTSIDELPQLFNVLKGDMSLVGPRPLPLRDYQGFDKDWHRRRFSIRPGITCLWQISGRSTVQFDRWMELDMEYIDHWSVWLDLEILIRTIPAVLKGSGAA